MNLEFKQSQKSRYKCKLKHTHISARDILQLLYFMYVPTIFSIRIIENDTRKLTIIKSYNFSNTQKPNIRNLQNQLKSIYGNHNKLFFEREKKIHHLVITILHVARAVLKLFFKLCKSWYNQNVFKSRKALMVRNCRLKY